MTEQHSAEALPSATDQDTSTATNCENDAAERGSTVNGPLPHTDDDKAQGETSTQRFISIYYILEFQREIKSMKNILNRSNNTRVSPYRTMQGSVQLHT